MYDFIIITHIPAFYKVNLYNELAKEKNILIIFIASNTNEKRSDDFVTLEKSQFEYITLHSGDIQDRNLILNLKKLKAILKECDYRKIIVGGWDLPEYWYISFSFPKLKNCLILESTINESKIGILRGPMKKLFLTRISTVYASGFLQKKLLDALKYEGTVKITRGVGIINKPILNNINKQYKKNYLYIGRLSKEKNVEMLIDIFNNLEDHKLTIIGTGPLENDLKMQANKNINFQGEIINQNLGEYFENHDVLLLASSSETWGLVIEEALYFGVPVIISSNCGACEIIKEGVNGYIVCTASKTNIRHTILTLNEESYQKLLDGVRKFSIEKKDLEQLRVYFAN